MGPLQAQQQPRIVKAKPSVKLLSLPHLPGSSSMAALSIQYPFGEAVGVSSIGSKRLVHPLAQKDTAGK